VANGDFVGSPDPRSIRAQRTRPSRRRGIFWWCWIIAAIAVSFGVYQFIHAAHLGYEDVGPGNAFGAHYSPGTRGGSGTYFVHVHVDSQHRNTDETVSGRTSLYELVLNDPSPVPVQQIEVDTFTNEVSRVVYDGQWFNVVGRQTKTTLLIAGTIAMLIALASLVCLVWNFHYRPRGRARLNGLKAASGAQAGAGPSALPPSR
jgi:hypothetical protein